MAKKKKLFKREVVIEIANNNKAQLHGPQPVLKELYDAMAVRHPNAFHLRKYMKPGWDGKQRYIDEYGRFAVGLTKRVTEKCKELKIAYEVADMRRGDELIPKVKDSFKNWKLRDYQKLAIEALTKNEIDGVSLPRGAIKVATNGGKTSISTFIYLAYKQKTVFLVNSKELYEQALVEIPEIIKGSIGRVDSKKIIYDNFMICMVATLRNRLKTDKELKAYMSTVKVLIVDEGDLANNKTNKQVIESLYNASVKVALSGTIFVSPLAKDKLKNYNLEGYFGPLLYEISNRELIDKGVSSEVGVRIVSGNTREAEQPGWQGEYIDCIVNNLKRNKKILRRSIYHTTKGRKNQLIIAQQHNHIINLFNLYTRAVKTGKLPKGTRIEWVHHDRKDRARIVDDFKSGKIDILIGSMILKRGKNFPKMTFMFNAGGGKSPENILQLLGRAFRGCKHYEDTYDLGQYLVKHSRKRIIYYKNEKIKVTIAHNKTRRAKNPR